MKKDSPIQPSLIVMGASAGGLRALQKIMGGLPRELEIPIVVVQHIPADSTLDFTPLFRNLSGYEVQEAQDKEGIRRGILYLAPAGYHLAIEKDRSFSLNVDEAVNHSRPSIDVLFESAAVAVGPDLVGVLLTGASSDGAAGLAEIRRRGGFTIVQDPAEAEVPVMPQRAIEASEPSALLTLAGISERMARFVTTTESTR